MPEQHHRAIERILSEVIRAHSPDTSTADYEAGRAQGFEEGKAVGREEAWTEYTAYLEQWKEQHLKAARPAPEPSSNNTAPPKQPPVTLAPQPERSRGKGAPAKDKLVREFLYAHPGMRYRDIQRELSHYTAVRVYSLLKKVTKGQPDPHVYKDEHGGFHLTERGREAYLAHHGAPDGNNEP